MHLPGGWPNIGKTSNKIPKFKDFGADFKYHSFFFQTRCNLKIHQKTQDGPSHNFNSTEIIKNKSVKYYCVIQQLSLFIFHSSGKLISGQFLMYVNV